MLALRLTRTARPAVQLRRLLVAAASAGTGFLLLSCLGYALHHPEAAGAAALRLAWCAAPLAATVYFALAVARTDPATRPRPGLSGLGLGPGRLMAISALTTALSCALGSMLALLVFLHLRGDLTGMPFDGAAADFLAADRPLPVPATLTLLALPPTIASTTVALALRPTDPRPTAPGTRRFGRFGAYGHTAGRETFGAYGRFGARFPAGTGARRTPAGHTGDGQPHARPADSHDTNGRPRPRPEGGPAPDGPPHPHSHPAADHADRQAHPRPAADHTENGRPHPHPEGDHAPEGQPRPHLAGSRDSDGQPRPYPAGSRAAGAARVGADGNVTAPVGAVGPEPPTPGTPPAPEPPSPAGQAPAHAGQAPAPVGLPWGVALLAAGLAVQAYAGRSAPTPSLTSLPGEAIAVLLGRLLTAAGLVLAAPGLTHLCGRLLQSTRPGALRLLAGRVLMAEADRIGRPLGVVCAVASAGYAMTALHNGSARAFGPLATLGALLVGGCTVATLLTAAVEARQCRADTTTALLRLGAPPTMLRAAAALRAATLVALFGPLTLAIAALAALPPAR